MLLSEGQLNDHVGARLMFDAMPRAEVLIADKGYDSDDFREALEECGITPCIPPRRNRKILIAYDKALYKTRHKIENLFAKLKDWRRVAARVSGFRGLSKLSVLNMPPLVDAPIEFPSAS